MAAARERCGGKLRDGFARAGLGYPARTVLLRAFKHERQLEVWAADESAGEFRRVEIYPVLGVSGKLGPKRREGDRQVPEGFYRVTRFNPRSRFHLSLGLDYPNESDRLLTANPQAPGSDIFIHGGVDSQGCLAMGDAAVEEIYLAARDAEVVFVHVFPCRMEAKGGRDVLAGRGADDPGLARFWGDVGRVYELFEQTRRLPVVTLGEDGRYVCRRATG